MNCIHINMQAAVTNSVVSDKTLLLVTGKAVQLLTAKTKLQHVTSVASIHKHCHTLPHIASICTMSLSK